MWAEVATQQMADSMVNRYLVNPAEFNVGFIYPALSASNPGFVEAYLPGDLGCNWRAYTWIPTNYYVFESLRKYGYNDLAIALSKETYSHVRETGDREYYTTQSNKGAGLDPFWGWSLLAYFMPYEYESGFDPTKISLEENYHILLREKKESALHFCDMTNQRSRMKYMPYLTLRYSKCKMLANRKPGRRQILNAETQ